MEQERILRLAAGGVDDLRITRGAQGDDDQRLGFAAGEQCRTVRTRQHADTGGDRAHVVQLATIDAHLGLQHAVAHGVVFEFLELLGHCGGGPAVLLGLRLEPGQHVGLDRGDCVATLQLVAHLEGGGQLIADRTLDGGDQRLVARRCLPVPRRLAGLGGQLGDRADRGLHLLMTEHHGAEHHVLGQQLGFGFHHQHRTGGTGDDQVEVGSLQLGLRGVQQVLAVGVTDAGGADRALERDAGQAQRGGGAEQGHDVAVHFRVQRDDLGDDLHFVLEVIREQRAHRAIDQARGQRLLLGRTAFALEEAAGNAAGGIELLDVVDGEREEILAFLLLGRGDGGDQHHGAAHAGHDRTGCLAGNFARLQRDFVITVLE